LQVSAGLDYSGVGPELSFWKATNRAKFEAATDAEALEGFRALTQLEGIIPGTLASVYSPKFEPLNPRMLCLEL